MNPEYPFEILIKTVKTIRSLKHDAGFKTQIIPSVTIYITDNPTYLGIVLNNWEKVLHMVKSEQMVVHYTDTQDSENSFLMELQPQ
jgi:uncharacterized membrane protein